MADTLIAEKTEVNPISAVDIHHGEIPQLMHRIDWSEIARESVMFSGGGSARAQDEDARKKN